MNSKYVSPKFSGWNPIFRYYETSAATGQGVQDMFSGVLTAVAEGKLVKAKPVVSAEQSSSKHK